MKRIISIFAVLVLGVALSCVKENKESLAPSFQIDMDNYGSIVMEMEKKICNGRKQKGTDETPGPG